jgi:hypothetical protein
MSPAPFPRSDAVKCARLWVEKPLSDEEWQQASRTQALPAIRPDIELLAKAVLDAEAELERLRRIEEAARRLMDSPAGNRYGFLPLLNALEGETPDVASEPEDR